MKKIAVLMTCFNRVNTTLTCLEGLFAQKIPEGYALDVWLVDDASQDKTGEKVKAAYPQVNVIQSSGNLFWCKGMRLAWDKAVEARKYDFYLWLNDDVVLNDNALNGIIQDCIAVNGVVVGTFSKDSSFQEVSYGATLDMPKGFPQEATRGMNGNMVIIPDRVFNKVGPIYGKYRHQYGDYDYGWSLLKAGEKYFASSNFSGTCPQQPERYLHLDGRSLGNRISLLMNPKGFCLHDAFIYRYRKDGFLRAIVSVAHIIAKVVFKLEK